MYQDYYIAGNGMKRMFEAEIVTILSALILIIPLVGWVVGLIGMLVGAVLSLTGLYSAGPAHPNFKNAFYLVIAGFVAGLLELFAGDGALGALLSVAGDVMSFGVTYFVCTAASELLSSKGDDYQADRGQLIWKLYAGCTAVAIAGSILAVIPIIGALAAVVVVISTLVALAASILYIIFLYKASQSLLS